MGVSQFILNGNKVVYVDCSNITSQRKQELKDNLDKGSKEIAGFPAKSAMVITNITNTAFDGEISDWFKKYAANNTPYVKASALVGLSGLQQIIFNAIKAVTRREFYIAKTLEEAKEYISKQ